MATQMRGARRRLRIRAALVALAFAGAVLVLAIQASSVWSTRTVSQHIEQVVPNLDTTEMFPASGERAINRSKFHRDRLRAVRSGRDGTPR